MTSRPGSCRLHFFLIPAGRVGSLRFEAVPCLVEGMLKKNGVQVVEGPACKDRFATLGFYNACRFDQVSRVTFDKDGSGSAKRTRITPSASAFVKRGKVNRSELLFWSTLAPA